MERLRQKDIHRLLDFTRRVYATRGRAQFGACAVHHLSMLAPCDWASYDEMIPAEGVSTNLFEPDTIRAPEAWTALMHEHPMLTHYLDTHDGAASQISDFLSPSQFRRLALYNEVYRPTGVDQEIVIALAIPLPSVVGFGAGRARRAFTARERLLLDLARPHLLQAYRNSLAFESLMRERPAGRPASDSAERRLAGLAADGRIASLDEQGGQWIDRFFGPRREGGRRLPDVLDRWVRSHDLPRSSRHDDPEPHADPLVVSMHGARLTIRLVPDSQRRLLILELRSLSTRNAPRASLLTARETEVMRWVRDGKNNADIGAILDCSTLTVKKHLEHVFVKLGVSNRTAAVMALDAIDAQLERS